MNHAVISFFLVTTLSFNSFSSLNINPGPLKTAENKAFFKDVKAFSSEWETPSSWNTKYEGNLAAYYFERSTPELNDNSIKGGIVAVFTRGIKDQEYNVQNKPLSLPLYMFPVQDNVNGIIEYRYAISQGSIQMVIQMEKNTENFFKNHKDQLEFRYFFIPDALLKQHKISNEQAKKLSYQQILEIMQPAA